MNEAEASLSRYLRARCATGIPVALFVRNVRRTSAGIGCTRLRSAGASQVLDLSCHLRMS